MVNRVSHYSKLFMFAVSATLAPAFALAGVPNPPASICFDDNCVTAPAPSQNVKKWHPGHYMQVLRGNADTAQSTRFTYYDQIASNTDLEGVVVPFRWSQLEGNTPGNYSAGIATIQAEISRLKSLSVPKRMILKVVDFNYGGTLPTSSHFPAYLGSADLLFQGTNGVGWKRWNSMAMGYFVDMLRAYAAAFDKEPYFEGILLIKETAPAVGSAPPSDYSATKYDAQLRRLALEARNAFARSNVIVPVNFHISQSATNSYIAYLATIGVGVGNPDTCADCKMWGDLAVQGLSGNVDHRRSIPLVWSVENSELGLDSVGPAGGYLPSQIYSYANDTLHVTHLLWDRNTFAGTSAQQWPAILKFISSNPLTSTRCPYSTCDTN